MTAATGDWLQIGRNGRSQVFMRAQLHLGGYWPLAFLVLGLLWLVPAAPAAAHGMLGHAAPPIAAASATPDMDAASKAATPAGDEENGKSGSPAVHAGFAGALTVTEFPATLAVFRVAAVEHQQTRTRARTSLAGHPPVPPPTLG
jgi:hypothetical protein